MFKYLSGRLRPSAPPPRRPPEPRRADRPRQQILHLLLLLLGAATAGRTGTSLNEIPRKLNK